MTQKPEETELDLAAFFAADMEADAGPSDELMAAVLRDAQALQPEPMGLAPSGARSWSFRLDFWDALGGWGAAGALSACLIVGVTLGITPPDGLSAFTDTVLENTGILTDEDAYMTLNDLMAEG